MTEVSVSPAKVSSTKLAVGRAAAALGLMALSVEGVDFGTNVSVGVMAARADGYYVTRAYKLTVAGRPVEGAPVEVLKDGRPYAVVRSEAGGAVNLTLTEQGTYTVLIGGRRRDRFAVKPFRAVRTLTIGGERVEELHTRPVWDADPYKRAGTHYVDHLVGGVLLRSAVRVVNEVVRTSAITGLRMNLVVTLGRTFEPPAPRAVRASVVLGDQVLRTEEAFGNLGDDISLPVRVYSIRASQLRVFLCPKWHDGDGWRYSADEVVVKSAATEVETELGWVPAEVRFKKCTDYYSYCVQADITPPTLYRVRTEYEPLTVPIVVDGIKPDDASRTVSVGYSAFEQFGAAGTVSIDGEPAPLRGSIEVVV